MGAAEGCRFTASASAVMAPARSGANSIGAAASVGAIGIPVVPPLDNGATPRACHWPCWSTGSSVGRGNEAQATPLHRSANTPALFQPGRGQLGASARRSGCAWLRDVNTRAVMAKQG